MNLAPPEIPYASLPLRIQKALVSQQVKVIKNDLKQQKEILKQHENLTLARKPRVQVFETYLNYWLANFPQYTQTKTRREIRQIASQSYKLLSTQERAYFMEKANPMGNV